MTKRNIDLYEELLLVERDLLTQFFEIADRRGRILPDHSQKLRIYLEKLKAHDEMVKLSLNAWRVRDEALSLIALAQHYGSPTRLLDWTYNAFVATFFASEDALNCLTPATLTSRLVVWAFHFPRLGKQDESSRIYDPVSIVTAPAATNIKLEGSTRCFYITQFLLYKKDFP